MFGLSGEFKKLKAQIGMLESERDSWRAQFLSLRVQWDELVVRINKKGGEDFLRHGSIYPTNPTIAVTQFTDAELKKLLMLCHPDKHDGKPLAVEMTQKLNALRSKK